MMFSFGAIADTVTWSPNTYGFVVSASATPCFTSEPIGTVISVNGQVTVPTLPCVYSKNIAEILTGYPGAYTHDLASSYTIVSDTPIANPINISPLNTYPATSVHYQWTSKDVDGVIKQVDMYLDTAQSPLVCSGKGGCHRMVYLLPSSYVTIN